MKFDMYRYFQDQLHERKMWKLLKVSWENQSIQEHQKIMNESIRSYPNISAIKWHIRLKVPKLDDWSKLTDEETF